MIWGLWIGIFNVLQTAGIFDLLQTVLTLVSLYFVKRGTEQVIWQTKFEMQVKAITKVRVCVSNAGRVIHYYKEPMGKEDSQYHYDIVYIRDWLSGMDKCIDAHYLETLLLGCEMGNVRIYENFIVYVSQSKKVIEAIQELILKIYGLIAQMHYLYIPIKGQPIRHWYIRACTNGDIAHWTAQYQKPKRQKYQGLVCGLVLEKNWPMLTCRNDVIIFSGSNEAMHHKIRDCQNERDLTRPPTTPDDS